MLDALISVFANIQEGVTRDAPPSLSLGTAVGKTLMFVLVLLVTRLLGKSVPNLDKWIDRYMPLLLMSTAIGALAYNLGRAPVVLAVAATTGLAIWWLERRRRLNSHEKKAARQRAVVLWGVAVLLAAASVSAVQISSEHAKRRATRLCLLLSFTPTGVESDALIGAWVTFARTWHEVFSGVEGVTISPGSATVEDFKTFADEAVVKDTKPDLVLRTRVNIPGKSILLLSRAYSDYESKRVEATFRWEGSIESLQFTALRGAANLLEHLRTMKEQPLSEEQHAQAARNLLQVYSEFLGIQAGDSAASALSQVQRALTAPTPIDAASIESSLDQFNVSDVVHGDAEQASNSRAAMRSKLAAAR